MTDSQASIYRMPFDLTHTHKTHTYVYVYIENSLCLCIYRYMGMLRMGNRDDITNTLAGNIN